VHGGIDHAEMKSLGIDPDRVLDFSVSTNPFMPPPGIREMLASLPIERYPDSSADELRRKLSIRLGMPPENILAGSGTTELIRAIALTYFRRGDPALLLEPTYDEYQIAARLSGARVIRHRAREADDFAPDIGEVVKLIKERRPRAVFVCNPNNPTGKYLARREIEAVLEATGDGLLVLDEAYVAFVAERWDPFDLTERGNTVVLRSMTKDYGLPGLRLGYAVARRDIVNSLRRVLPPWNVNIVAQGVGLAVLEKEDYLRQTLERVREAKKFLAGELAGLGFRVDDDLAGARVVVPPLLAAHRHKQALYPAVVGRGYDLPGVIGSPAGARQLPVARCGLLLRLLEVRLHQGPGLPVQGITAHPFRVAGDPLAQQVRIGVGFLVNGQQIFHPGQDQRGRFLPQEVL